MYAITGITGQVGGSVANSLLQQGLKVRAIVRSPDKARQWAEKGCEITVADFYDQKAMAMAFSSALGHAIRAVPVPRDQWETLFQNQGTPDPSPRIEMLDGFNSDWIDFEGSPAEHVIGRIGLPSVVQSLVASH
jgi:hypothetical protein